MIQTLFGSTEEKPSFLERMKEAVTRTRESLSERIDDIALIGKEIDRDTLDELEATLIGADLGMATTSAVLETLREKVDRKQIGDISRTEARAERRVAQDPQRCRATTGAEGRWRARSDPGGWREWHGEDDVDRQTGVCAARARKDCAAGSG